MIQKHTFQQARVAACIIDKTMYVLSMMSLINLTMLFQSACADDACPFALKWKQSGAKKLRSGSPF